MSKLLHEHPDFWLFHSMKKRCSNPNHKMFKYYGGRGIRVCERWLQPRGAGFRNFLADLGARPHPSLTLDRVDNDGNYEPGNCRWATRETQYENRRSTVWLELNGERKTATQWAKKLGLSKGQAITERLKDGHSLEVALTAMRVSRDPESFAKSVEAAAAARRAQTHCKRGHPLSGDNLRVYVSPAGQRARVCKACVHLKYLSQRQR